MPWTIDDLTPGRKKRDMTLPPGDPKYVTPPELAAVHVNVTPGDREVELQLIALIEEHAAYRLAMLNARGMTSDEWLYDVIAASIQGAGDMSVLTVDIRIARPGFLPAHFEHYKALLDNMILTDTTWIVQAIDWHLVEGAYSPQKMLDWQDGLRRVATQGHVTLHRRDPRIGWRKPSTP